MKKHRDIMRKCENGTGVHDTKKYRYKVVYGLHVQLMRIEKQHLDTMEAYNPDNWKTVYTLL